MVNEAHTLPELVNRHNVTLSVEWYRTFAELVYLLDRPDLYKAEVRAFDYRSNRIEDAGLPKAWGWEHEEQVLPVLISKLGNVVCSASRELKDSQLPEEAGSQALLAQYLGDVGKVALKSLEEPMSNDPKLMTLENPLQNRNTRSRILRARKNMHYDEIKKYTKLSLAEVVRFSSE
jgi:hypothetical protein